MDELVEQAAIQALKTIGVTPLAIVRDGDWSVDFLFRQDKRHPLDYSKALQKLLPQYRVVCFRITRDDCLWASFRKHEICP